jgi:hypothetical protein
VSEVALAALIMPVAQLVAMAASYISPIFAEVSMPVAVIISFSVYVIRNRDVRAQASKYLVGSLILNLVAEAVVMSLLNKTNNYFVLIVLFPLFVGEAVTIFVRRRTLISTNFF